MLAWYILLCLLTFNLYASLYLKWVSFKQHRDGSCFFMHSDNLFYLAHLDHWHSERSFCHSRSIVYSINYYFLFVALVLCPYFCVQLLFCLSAVLITFFFSFLGILVILPFKKILVVAIEFAIYLYLIQVHFQITRHNFMDNVSML